MAHSLPIPGPVQISWQRGAVLGGAAAEQGSQYYKDLQRMGQTLCKIASLGAGIGILNLKDLNKLTEDYLVLVEVTVLA